MIPWGILPWGMFIEMAKEGIFLKSIFSTQLELHHFWTTASSYPVSSEHENNELSSVCSHPQKYIHNLSVEPLLTTSVQKGCSEKCNLMSFTLLCVLYILNLIPLFSGMKTLFKTLQLPRGSAVFLSALVLYFLEQPTRLRIMAWNN